MSNNYGPKIPTNGLCFVIDPADKNSYPGIGTSCTDLVNSETNTLSNADIGTNTENEFDFSGNAGNQGGRFIDLPDTIGYTTEVSFFSWFKRTTNTNVLGTYHIICGDGPFEMSVQTGGGYLRNGVHVNGTRYVANQGSTIGTNTWHCLGVTYTNYTKTAYIDGTAVGTQTCGSSGNLDNSVSNRRLGRYGTHNYAMVGNLGSFMVWDRVLSASEVVDLYEAQRGRFRN